MPRRLDEKPDPTKARSSSQYYAGKTVSMNLALTIAPLISLISGILILSIPRLLNYIVAIYPIVIGLLGLFSAGNFNLH
jgi:hypothetical protein